MSEVSERVRVGLFNKLNVTSVKNAIDPDNEREEGDDGIYHRIAPKGVSRPYVVFHRQAARPVNYNFGPTLCYEDDLWLVKVVTDEDSSETLEPEALAEDILETCETAIGTSLTLSSGETWWVKRNRTFPVMWSRWVIEHFITTAFNEGRCCMTYEVVKGFNITDKNGKESRYEPKKKVSDKDFTPEQWKALVEMEAVKKESK